MFEGLEPRQVLAANLVISEIMATNNATLRDEDNQFSDWIEIFNADINSVNLGDWYLTDNDGVLDKWRFPNQTIAPGDYLIVFASGKNRAVAGEELHTNFALSAGGEYVALVFDDPLIDLTPVSAFDPRFPSQLIDVSFGFNQTATQSTLLAAGAPVKALVPSVANGGSALGTTWTASDFDDTTWTSGTTGVGYDTGSDFDNVIGLDLPGMQNNGTSAFLRVPFDVSNPGAVNRLSLDMKYDDGFVAYLNGTEVARANAPASPAWVSTATAFHG
jgi:hypothetical protein